MATARISRDELAAWREHPATRWMLEALARHAAAYREQWLAMSWEAGTADQGALIELRSRADEALAITETDYDAMCVALGEEPVDE